MRKRKIERENNVRVYLADSLAVRKSIVIVETAQKAKAESEQSAHETAQKTEAANGE